MIIHLATFAKIWSNRAKFSKKKMIPLSGIFTYNVEKSKNSTKECVKHKKQKMKRRSVTRMSELFHIFSKKYNFKR